MSSRFKEFHDNIILSGEISVEILRKVKNMKIGNKSIGAKSVYITISALLAAIVLTVIGGNFILNSGIPDRGLTEVEQPPEVAEAIKADADIEVNNDCNDNNSEEDTYAMYQFEDLNILLDELGIFTDELASVRTGLNENDVFRNIGDIEKSINNIIKNIENFTDDFNWDNISINRDSSNNIPDNNIFNDLSEIKAIVYDEAKISERYFDNISEVKIDTIRNDIKITQGGDRLFIRYGEWYDDEFTLTIDKGKMMLSSYENIPFYEDETTGSLSNNWISDYVKGKEVPIEIVVPYGMEINFDLDVVVGDIYADNCVLGAKFYADTLNGNVKITSSTINGNSEMSTFTGAINITDSTIKGTLNVNAITGNIGIANSIIGEFTANAKNGKVTVSNVTTNGYGYIKIDILNGNILIKDSTANGDITINILNTKNYEIENSIYNDLYVNGKKGK